MTEGKFYGPVHGLTIWRFDIEGRPDIDILHSPDCAQEDKGGYYDWSCGINWEIDNSGPDVVLAELEISRAPAHYLIRHWTENWNTGEGIEYDAGVEGCLLEPADVSADVSGTPK